MKLRFPDIKILSVKLLDNVQALFLRKLVSVESLLRISLFQNLHKVEKRKEEKRKRTTQDWIVREIGELGVQGTEIVQQIEPP